MDGVRRWIRSGSPLRRASVRVEPKSDTTSKSSKLDHRPDKTSTEYVATIHMNPVVSSGEKQEYEDYIEQCQEMLDVVPDLAESKDLKTYESAVALAGWGDDIQLNPPERDVHVMYAYLDKATSSTSDPVLFNYYDKWLYDYPQYLN